MLKSKTVQVVGLLVCLLSLGTAALAQRDNRWDNQRNDRRDNQRGRWEYLGEANVDGQRDHDFIRVGRSEGRFSRLQIHVDRAPITFERVVVHFANGGDEVINMRNRIPAGGQTRAIDLRGNDRVITGVEFWYSRGNYRSRQPHVRLYGY